MPKKCIFKYIKIKTDLATNRIKELNMNKIVDIGISQFKSLLNNVVIDLSYSLF